MLGPPFGDASAWPARNECRLRDPTCGPSFCLALRLTVRMLTDLGYRVREAAEPRAALDILAREEEVRLLFTDVVMPDIDGRRLAELAQKLRPGLKVLYTTGYTRKAVVHNGVLDPGVALLPKPFPLAQVGAKLREVLGPLTPPPDA